jgi:hypothetical protein
MSTEPLAPPHPSAIAKYIDAKAPEVLYHYTDQHGLLGMVRDGKMWATSWDCLNDSEEALVLQKIVRRQLEQRVASTLDRDLKALLEHLLNKKAHLHPATWDQCVACWSEARDELSQWRAYSGSDTGYSIGLSGITLKAIAARAGGIFVPCIYEPEEQEKIVSSLIDHAVSVGYDDDETWSGDFVAFLLRYSAMFKDYHFAAEREWRILTRVGTYESTCFRAGKSTLRTYLPVDLTTVERSGKTGVEVAEILIGPTPSANLAAQKVYYLLRRHCNSSGGIPVRSSSIPFRNW